MKSEFARLFFLLATLTVAASAIAQNPNSASTYRGFNAYEDFRGVVNSSGSLLKLDSSLGYDFNRNLGVFAGLPIYFANGPGNNAGSGKVNESGIGDAYFGAEVYVSSRFVRYSSTVTVGAPTGSVSKGFSPGEFTADWTNRFRSSWGRVTPSFSVGLGNTVGVGVGALTSSELITRALSSTGTIVHLEEGAEFALARRAYLGAGGYHILPVGSNAGVQSAVQGADQASLTGGTSQLRENGVEAWLGFEPSRVVRMELGYSRSTTFASSRLSFNLGLNVGRMLRRSRSSRSAKAVGVNDSRGEEVGQN